MLVPLVISGVYLHTISGSAPLLDNFAHHMFIITGAINFFNLLPLWPLDGGRIVRSVTMGISPKASQMLTMGMSIALILWALISQYFLILIVAMLGLNAARASAKLSERQPPMSGNQAIAATFAYLLSLWAFWLAGHPLISQILFRTAG